MKIGTILDAFFISRKNAPKKCFASFFRLIMPIGCDSSPLGSKILSYLSHSLKRTVIYSHHILKSSYDSHLSPLRLHTPFRHLISRSLILRRASPHFRSLTFPPPLHLTQKIHLISNDSKHTTLFTPGRLLFFSVRGKSNFVRKGLERKS